MVGLMKKLHLASNYRILFIFIVISSLCGIVAIRWQFWLIFEIALCMVLVAYFSKGFRDLLNIHSVATGLIVLYTLPSSILILQGKIALSDTELLMFFSAIGMGLVGYAFGVLFFKGLFSSKKKKNTQLSKKINALFWLAYKYRYVLTFIACIVLFQSGLMPKGISYRESITYRVETTVVTRYFNSLIPTVFSVLMIAMISIVGDSKKHKKLSWLSYLLIILVVLSVIGGHRIWVIALFACFMISFQPYLKRKYMLPVVILAFFSTFVMSGAVRYARGGETSIEVIKKFYEYFSNFKNMTFTDLMWGWSSLNSPFSTFITLIKNIPENINFDYLAYARDFVLLIPKAIYPERPLPYNEWYVKTFEPELFKIGGGKTFYVLGFGYLFAGPIGVFIHLFLFGALFEWLNKVFKMIGTAAGLFLYSYFFVELLRFVMGCGFIVFIKASLILNFVIPITLLFLFTFVLDSLIPKKVKS